MLGVSVFGFGLAFKAEIIIILRCLNFSKLPNIVQRWKEALLAAIGGHVPAICFQSKIKHGCLLAVSILVSFQSDHASIEI